MSYIAIGQKVSFVSAHGHRLTGEVVDFTDEAVRVSNPVHGLMIVDMAQFAHLQATAKDVHSGVSCGNSGFVGAGQPVQDWWFQGFNAEEDGC